MSRLTPARAFALAGAAALAATLAGCGKMGELQRPAPMFGRAPSGNAQARADEEQDASRPVRTIDPRDEIHDPSPSRTIQVPGMAPDPIGPGPQGSLPDPYSNPR
jgi:hypothetical protein